MPFLHSNLSSVLRSERHCRNGTSTCQCGRWSHWRWHDDKFALWQVHDWNNDYIVIKEANWQINKWINELILTSSTQELQTTNRREGNFHHTTVTHNCHLNFWKALRSKCWKLPSRFSDLSRRRCFGTCGRWPKKRSAWRKLEGTLLWLLWLLLLLLLLWLLLLLLLFCLFRFAVADLHLLKFWTWPLCT